MDSEVLENASERIVKGILSQDVTFYVDLLAPDVTLNALYDNTTLPQPITDAAKQQASEENERDGKADGGAGGAEGLGQQQGVRGLTADVCKTMTGLKAFAEATFHIYQWLQRGKHIMQPNVVVEPRRPRKDAASASNATANKPAPQPASPRGNAGQTKAAPTSPLALFKTFRPGNQTERNARLQNYSKVTLTWGRINLQLRDEIYFEEGLITIVDRSLLVPDDLSKPQYAHDRSSFYNETSCRVDTRGHHPPVLDFTFAEINDVVDLLRVKPANGRLHKVQGVMQVAAKQEKTNNTTVFQGAAAAAKQAAGKTLIKAKNKKGEEEAYEFGEDRGSRAIKAEKEISDDIVGRLGDLLECKYEAQAFRLSNNAKLKDVQQLVPVLRTLIANSFLTLTWIDLNSNGITHLPTDLDSLPLTSLYLHGNLISDWGEVDRVVCALPFLASVTLHGTPLAQQPNYKQELLIKLMTSPLRQVPLKQIDFVTVSTQDVVVGSMYESFKKGTTKAMLATKVAMKEIAQQSVRGRSPRAVTPRGKRNGGASMSPRR